MTTKQLNFSSFPSLAIADGDTTFNPGAAGVWAWSTTLSAPMYWSGTAWNKLASSIISIPSGTANQVQYLNGSKALVGSANLTFNGTTLTANTVGAFTLAGTVAGGGNQLNNVIIGTTTPLAGAFTTLSSTLAITSGTDVKLADGGYTYAPTGSASGTVKAGIQFNGNGNITSKISDVTITNTSATGLAVTGTLSATGVLSNSEILTSSGILTVNGTNVSGTFISVQNSGTAQSRLGSWLRLIGSGAATDSVVYADGAKLGLAVAGTVRATATTTGLDVTGTLSATGKGTFTDASDSGQIYLSPVTSTQGAFLRCANGGGNSYIGADNSTGSNFGGGNYGLNIFSPNQVTITSGNTNKLVFATSGNLGIGTSSPSTRLDVVGTGGYLARLYGDASNYLRAYCGSGYQILEANGANQFGYFSGDFFVQTGAVDRMRVDSSGKLTVTGGATIQGLTVGRGAGAGASNTAVGANAFAANTTGVNNTALGTNALTSNTTGGFNTAFGGRSLSSNTTGFSNTASGVYALQYNTTGYSNTASGQSALQNNITGFGNTAFGVQTLFVNDSGNYNTATGMNALQSNTSGSFNTATGQTALYTNSTGNYNAAYGMSALQNNTIGSGNTALGSQYTAAGAYFPAFNCTTEDNRVSIAHTGVTNAYVKVAWTVVSDARDKTNFAVVPHGLEFVKQLKPVAYQFKVSREDDTPHGNVKYGFKAQDILELEGENPVIIDNETPDHLKFVDQHLMAVMVKAIQELTAKVERLEAQLSNS